MSIIIRDKTTSAQGLAVNADGSINSSDPNQEWGDDGRAKVGMESMLLFEGFDGTVLDLNKFATTTSTMTATLGTVQTGAITLNAGSSVLFGAYANLVSIKQFLVTTEFPLYVQFRARLVPQTNATIEFGFGLALTNASPTDGCFFRMIGNTLYLVVNHAGTETTQIVTMSPSLDSTQYYNFELSVRENEVVYEIEQTGASSGTGSQSTDEIPGGTTLPFGRTLPTPISISHMPVFARVFNTATPSSAASLHIGALNVNQYDLQFPKPWSHTLASMGKTAHQLPSAVGSFAQSAQYANSAAPTSASLANTTAGYTTLGGLFQFAAVAGAATDYALFAYLIPVGFQFTCVGIHIEAYNSGATVATTPTLLQWAIGVNSSAVSLATTDGAGTWGPRRKALGFQSFPIGAVVGANASNVIDYDWSAAPMCVDSARYLHVILRMPVGTATASQIIAGSVTIRGYFE